VNVSVSPDWISARKERGPGREYCVEFEAGSASAIVWLTHEQFCELRDRITTTLSTIEYAPKEES
jgi:hypothetical protein